jgi:hypothetical protein
MALFVLGAGATRGASFVNPANFAPMSFPFQTAILSALTTRAARSSGDQLDKRLALESSISFSPPPEWLTSWMRYAVLSKRSARVANGESQRHVPVTIAPRRRRDA